MHQTKAKKCYFIFAKCSKKKTYGPYEGHLEKLNEPIELNGRVIKYKPVVKLSAKKSVQKGGEPKIGNAEYFQEIGSVITPFLI